MVWKAELTYTVVTWTLLVQIILLVSLCTSTKTPIDEMIEASSKRKPMDTLQCHVCHSETEFGCYNFTQFGEDFDGFPRQCDANSTYCVVRKFSFTLTDENGTLPMKTFAIKRNCSSKCDPGCVIMGERTRLYVCNSCCSNNLCNTDGGSQSLHHRGLDYLLKRIFVSACSILSIFHASSTFSFLSP